MKLFKSNATATTFFVLLIMATLLPVTKAFSKTQDQSLHNHRTISKISPLIIKSSANSQDPTFDIDLSVDGHTFNISLQTNLKLSKKLDTKQKNPPKILKGTANSTPNSWARLTLKDGFYTGAFFDGHELYFIDAQSAVSDIVERSASNLRALTSNAKQVIYKASNVELNASCALEIHNPTASAFDYSAFVDDLSAMTATIAGRRINVKILADTEFNTANNGAALERMLSEMNVVEGIFSQQVNVELDITEAIVLTDNGSLITNDATQLVYNLRTEVAQSIGNQGVTHLFTGKELSGNTVGIAFVDALCSSYGVGLSQNYGSATALVVAHEIGHNFGAPHDAQSGSACSSTPNTFLMNPYITGSDQFSACSLNQIEQGIASANTRYANTCVVDVVVPGPVAPLITSIAGLEATVGEAYEYDSDNTVEATGSTPLTFSFDYAPDGMTINSDGLISWTPTASQVGINSAQLRVSNAAGEDIQIFDIEVSHATIEAVINFNESANFSYGGSSQDTPKGTVTISDDGATLHLVGNRWRAITIDYNITPETILEFDFKSSAKGDIHGIGFDTDLALSENATFKVFGTQTYGIPDFVYTGNGDYQRFSIPVGQYYTGAMAYLFLAMDHDVSNPTAQSHFSNIRVYEPAPSAPTINSQPNLRAQVGISYLYDADSIVEVSGTAPFTYAFNYAPEGMSIDSEGKINWTPNELQLGAQQVELVASNALGDDIQSFTVNVTQPFAETINLNNYELISYGGGNDDLKQGTIDVSETGHAITLIGNRWVAINYPYVITANTVIEFDFHSTNKGEIHGIGLDQNLSLGEDTTFKLYGTQNFGIKDYNYENLNQVQHFSIPAGQYLSSDSQYVFFVMDHDVKAPTATSQFSNIRIYENISSTPIITSTPSNDAFVGTSYQYDEDFSVNVISSSPVSFSLEESPVGMLIDNAGLINWTPTSEQSGENEITIAVTNYNGTIRQSFVINVAQAKESAIKFDASIFEGYGSQDTNNGTINIEDGDVTLRLVGNRWQTMPYNYILTTNSVLEFEFKSTTEAEIHGIGLDDDTYLSENKLINIYGTQAFGEMSYRYSGSGDFESFSIPIGPFYTGQMNYIFFAMDHDVKAPSGNSYFRNVKITER